MKNKSTKYYYQDLDSQLKSVKKNYTLKECLEAAKKRKKNPFFIVIDFFESAKLYRFDECEYEKQKSIIVSFYKENKKTNEELILRKYFLERQNNTKYSVTLPILLSLIASFLYSLLNSFKENQVNELIKRLTEFNNLIKENITYILQYSEISSIVINTYLQFLPLFAIMLIAFIVITILFFRLLPGFIEGFKLNKNFIVKFEIDYISKLMEENSKENIKNKDEYAEICNELNQIRNQLSNMQKDIKRRKR